MENKKYIENEKSYEERQIEYFINWYHQEAMKYCTTEIGQFYQEIDMAHLINKIATWYELKYNSEQINNEHNPNTSTYTNELLMAGLSWDELMYFKQTRYTNSVKIAEDNTSKRMALNSDGTVMKGLINRNIPDEFVGMHLKEVLSFIEEEDLPFSTSSMKQAIANYEMQELIKKRLAESIIYRLISSDKKYGLKRALKFAQDFHLDPHLLITYANDSQDIYLFRDIALYDETFHQQHEKTSSHTSLNLTYPKN